MQKQSLQEDIWFHSIWAGFFHSYSLHPWFRIKIKEMKEGKQEVQKSPSCIFYIQNYFFFFFIFFPFFFYFFLNKRSVCFEHFLLFCFVWLFVFYKSDLPFITAPTDKEASRQLQSSIWKALLKFLPSLMWLPTRSDSWYHLQCWFFWFE